MIRTKLELAALAILATVLLLASWEISHLRKQRDKANSKVAQMTLEAEGFKQALSVKPKEVVKLVPQLVTKTVEKLIKEDKVQPVAAATIEAHKDLTIEFPPSISNGNEVKAEPQPVPVHLRFYADLLVTRIKFGIATEWKADSGGSIGVADQPPLEFKFDEDEAHFEVRFSEDIAKALYDHEREGGWLKRHTALVCPGVGVTYNPLDTARPVNAGITCTYGFSWF